MRRTLPFFLGFGVACTGPQGSRDLPALRINELMALSASGPDWVELYNPSDRAVALDRWTIGEDYDQRLSFHPGTEIGPQGTLVLIADDQSGPDHVELKLDGDGESLELFDPDGLSVDRITWGPLLDDLSLARTPDGGEDWQIRTTPTPGAPNGGTPVGEQLVDNPCVPQLTSPPYGLEGEPLHLEADCPHDAAIAWFGPDDGPTLDWTPGLDDAGLIPALISAKPTSGASVPNTVRVELSIADAWSDPDNVAVQPETYTSEWGLPVLHVGIDPNAITQDYQPATTWLDGVSYSSTIKIRGAASVDYPKNNFTMEFDPIQLDLGDHGLQNKDHLVLVSNFDDVSHLRQRLVYDTWAAIADTVTTPRATPRSTPVVVYLDGTYHGLYLALDHVDDEFLREMGFTDGGDLYKSVTHDANFYLHDAGGSPKTNLALGWEKKEGADPYDYTAIEAITAWAGSVDHATAAAELDLWVDRTEFIDWFHLVFALACDDSAGKNAYLYVDPPTGLYRFVPWDFNHAVGQTWQTARQDPTGLNPFTWNNAIFWHLQSEPGLADEHWTRLQTLRAPGGPLALDTLLARLDTYDAELGGHPDRDWERWGDAFLVHPLWSFRDDWTTPAEERAYVEQWLVDRDAVLDAL